MQSEEHSALHEKLIKMSISELEVLLQQDIIASNGGEPDVEFIITITKLIVEKERSKPDYSPVDTEQAKQEFKEKLREMPDVEIDIPVECKDRKQAKPQRVNWRALRRCVAIAAIMTALLLGTAQAVGVDILGAFAKWSDEVFQFQDAQQLLGNDTLEIDEGEEIYVSSLEEATDTAGINLKLIPNWIPEGYALQSAVVSKFNGEISINAEFSYETDDSYIFITMYQRLSSNYTVFEKEEEVEIVSLENIDHYIMRNYDQQIAVWLNEDWECSIQGFISQNDLKKMIMSIYE